METRPRTIDKVDNATRRFFFSLVKSQVKKGAVSSAPITLSHDITATHRFHTEPGCSGAELQYGQQVAVIRWVEEQLALRSVAVAD